MLVEDMAESDSLLDSHIMITDWSGAGIEYGLGLEKPVLYIDVPPKARNEWWPKIGLEPFESFVRDKIGAIVPPDKLEEIPNSIRELLEKSGSFSQRIESLQNEWVFNPDNSAAEGARAIAELAAQSDKHSELPGGD
jgi:YidC/Oxa1 family membrane protein insertase